MSTVLITGASTGIGRATAIHLAAKGYRVFAGVRTLADSPPQTLPLLLDVTNPAEIAAAAARLESEDVSAVINNAGYNYLCPFEYSDESSARRLMDVNFFGLCRLSQALVPHLRRHAAAHIGQTAKLINISSIGGLIGIPWEVYYHASKFAVVGLPQGLRSELWSQNIRAVVVCPGGVRTPFLPKTEQALQATIEVLSTAAPAGYRVGLNHFAELIGTADRLGVPPEAVAAKIAHVLGQRNPALRQLVGFDARVLFMLSRLLPQHVFGYLLRTQFAPS